MRGGALILINRTALRSDDTDTATGAHRLNVANATAAQRGLPLGEARFMDLSPRMLVLLLVVAATAAASAIWLTDHRDAVRASAAAIAGLLLVFFICAGWILLLMLRAQERRRSRQYAAARAAAPPRSAPELAGTVHGLIAGRVYRVVQPFCDCYANRFEAGELLRFRERHFLPYHGGHTLVFEERSIYLQEDQSRLILDNFSSYLAPAASESPRDAR